MFDHNKSEKCQLPFAPFCLPCLYIVHIIMLIYQLISCSHIMFTQRLSKAWVIWGWENMAEQITKKGGKGTINIHKCLCICIYIYMCVCVCFTFVSKCLTNQQVQGVYGVLLCQGLPPPWTCQPLAAILAPLAVQTSTTRRARAAARPTFQTAAGIDQNDGVGCTTLASGAASAAWSVLTSLTRKPFSEKDSRLHCSHGWSFV